MTQPREHHKISPVTQWALAAVGAVAVAVMSFVSTKVWDHESRLSSIEQISIRMERLVSASENNSKIALGVAEQHGAEFIQTRSRLTTIENQIQTSVEMLSQQIAATTDDRFRRTEWIAAKKAYDLQMETVIATLKAMERTISELPPDEWERKIERLEKAVNNLIATCGGHG